MPTIEIPDTQLLFRTVKALHRRIELLENKQARIDQNMGARVKTVLRLYNRYYAQNVRRREDEKRSLDLVKCSYKNWQRHLRNGSIQRLSMTLARIGKGRTIPTLTPREFTKLRTWLKNDFRSKRP